MISSILRPLDAAYNSIANPLSSAIARVGADRLAAAYDLAEAAVVHQECHDPKWAQHIHRIHNIFSVVNFFQLVKSLDPFIPGNNIPRGKEREYGQLLASRSFSNPVVQFWLKVGGAAFAAYGVTYLINRFYSSRQKALDLSEVSEEMRPNISATWDRPFSQCLAQVVYVAQIFANIALAVRTKNYQALAINTMTRVYNLWNITQLRWMELSRSFSTPNELQISGFKVSYHSLLLPFRGPSTEICVNCRDEAPQSYYCVGHGYHDRCIAAWFAARSDRFGNVDSLQRTDNYRDRVCVGCSYEARMKEEELPNCPTCRSYPAHAFFSINVDNREKGNISGTVTITDRTSQPSLLARMIDGIPATIKLFF